MISERAWMQVRNRRVDKLGYGGKKGRSAKRWLAKHCPGWGKVMAS